MEPTRSDHIGAAELAKLGLSRETELRLDPAGRFFNGAQPIEHPGVCAAFARWVARTDSGRYALRNELHYVYLTVEGAPLHAARVEGQPPARPQLLLTGGAREPLRVETLWRDREGVLYVAGRDGSWTVRLSAQAALDLGPWLAERDGEVVCEVDGAAWPIPEGERPRPAGGEGVSTRLPGDEQPP